MPVVMRRAAIVACTAVSLALVAGTAGGQPSAPRSWAAPQITAVINAGLMAPSVAAFRPDDALTWGELGAILATLGMEAAVADPARPVTIRELDGQLVTVAGLRPEARAIRLAALDAGLSPQPWLGTETIARLLGFRINHLMDSEQLELQLNEPATRAEAAYSVARFLTLTDVQIETVRQTASTFVAPSLTEWQRMVLTRAVRFVGSPYVFAGTSEKPQLVFGKPAPGGFDCSGFVWRVYKLQPFAGATALPEVLSGRSSYEMSGEVPPSARITRNRLQPGDIAFFGTNGPRSKPSEVGHMGIYLGNGWIVHSSRFGTTLQPMVDWYDTTFAWGRRPLAEAGIS
jgi:cell wall-associated NlpC family hydrolase